MGQPRQDILDGTAEIDLDRRAGPAVKNENRRIPVPIERLLRRPGDVAEIAGSNAAVAFKGHSGGVKHRIPRQFLNLVD